MQEYVPTKYSPLPSVDSYFPASYPSSAVSSAASTPAPGAVAGFPSDAASEPTRRSTRSTVVKKHSISSLLSSPDSVSSDSSGVSSPGALWSAENSPTSTASASTRSSSVASSPWTPAQPSYRESFDHDMPRRRNSLLGGGFDHIMAEVQKVGPDVMSGGKRKSRRLVQFVPPIDNEGHWKADSWL
ncbi:hypothetical protein Q9L58_008855 [Maublancomyces gigas]|uniref:Uncharacterized protein n=1 Tax=Discina gigas TaxID=1032678 RepID=A0ABR3G8I4_9PEZI